MISDDETNWKTDGIFMLALPDSTLELVRKISKSTGKSFPDVIAESIMMLGERVLAKQEKEVSVEAQPKRVKMRFK